MSITITTCHLYYIAKLIQTINAIEWEFHCVIAVPDNFGCAEATSNETTTRPTN